MLRKCSKCGCAKELSEFNQIKKERNKGTWKGYRSECRVCLVEIRKNYRLRNPGRDRLANKDWKLRKAYGINLQDWNRMAAEQEYRCAVCGGFRTPPGFVVDHDHVHGHVRGLLCSTCNIGLGQFYDDPETLELAAKYLRADRMKKMIAANDNMAVMEAA